MKQILIVDDAGRPIYQDFEKGEILCPLLSTFQLHAKEYLGQHVRSMTAYSQNHCTQLSLQTHGRMFFLACSDQGEPAAELDSELQLIRDLLAFAVGPKSVASSDLFSWRNKQHQKSFVRLVDTALALCSAHSSVLVRAMEQLEVNDDIRATCSARLRDALAEAPEVRGAALFVGTRVLAQYQPAVQSSDQSNSYSSSSSSQLSPQDVLFLMLHVHSLFRPATRCPDKQPNNQTQQPPNTPNTPSPLSTTNTSSSEPVSPQNESQQQQQQEKEKQQTVVGGISAPIVVPTTPIAPIISDSPASPLMPHPQQPSPYRTSSGLVNNSNAATTATTTTTNSNTSASSPSLTATRRRPSAGLTPQSYFHSPFHQNQNQNQNQQQQQQQSYHNNSILHQEIPSQSQSQPSQTQANQKQQQQPQKRLTDKWLPNDLASSANVSVLYLRSGGGPHVVYSAELLPGIFLAVVVREHPQRIQDQCDHLSYAHVAIRDWLAQDYAPFLLTKERAHMPMLSYVAQVPGVVHFIFVDRVRHLAVVPSVAPLYGQDGISKANHSAASLRKLIWRLVQIAHSHLSRGCTTAIVKSDGFNFSYRLWLEGDSDGDLPPALERTAVAQKLQPWVVCPQLYSDLIAHYRASRCYELYSLYLGVVPITAIAKKDRQLLHAMSTLTGNPFSF